MRVKRENIVAIYRKKATNVSQTCDALGISRTHFYRLRNSDKKLDEALSEVEEAIIDNVESKLIVAINQDNLSAITFYLKTKAKKRGWSEGTEVVADIKAELTPSIDMSKLSTEELLVFKSMMEKMSK